MKSKYHKNPKKLWSIAKKYIPGGNMFLSKRPERFLPDLWPTFYRSSKKCFVTDLRNRQYVDMIMGIGTNIEWHLRDCCVAIASERVRNQFQI